MIDKITLYLDPVQWSLLGMPSHKTFGVSARVIELHKADSPAREVRACQKGDQREELVAYVCTCLLEVVVVCVLAVQDSSGIYEAVC